MRERSITRAVYRASVRATVLARGSLPIPTNLLPIQQTYRIRVQYLDGKHSHDYVACDAIPRVFASLYLFYAYTVLACPTGIGYNPTNSTRLSSRLESLSEFTLLCPLVLITYRLMYRIPRPIMENSEQRLE